jgi:hypothetical protein
LESKLSYCMHPDVYHYVVLLYGRQHYKFQVNKQTNVTVLTFIYYSVSTTCFDPAGSSSGSFHNISLVIELCSNMDPY